MARAECARLARLLVVAMAMGASAQCDVEEGDMCLRVMGSSGKIMICDGRTRQRASRCGCSSSRR
ncbi:hypothetical protein DIPPA_29211 [Diplonema papillatum]|nr:hypothetical protein DIPPA_29211 [Diplonema papillatum]